MRLERLTIDGFFHFDQPFVLDLQALPAGLIAIVGPNGAGKTTALDAALAGLYGPGVQNRAFPSRDGTLATYATRRDASIETLWQLDGRGLFRARVNVDGQRRQADAVLETIGPDGGARPLNDGKVATFKDAVAGLFPSLRSLLASAYAAQNKRGGFGELSQKERLELFVELADLVHYETLSQTAKRCQQIAETAGGQLRAALDVFRREDVTPERRAALQSQIDETDHRCGALEATCATMICEIFSLERDRRAATHEAERHAAATACVGELEQAAARAVETIAMHEASWRSVEADHQADGRAIVQREKDGLATIDRRRREATTTHAHEEADRQSRMTANRVLLSQAPSILAAVIDVRASEQESAKLRQQEQEAREQKRALLTRRGECQVQLSHGCAAAEELAGVMSRAGLLRTVKFGESCAVDPVCPLVADAVAAKERIPALEARAAAVEALESEIAALDGEIVAADVAIQRVAAHVIDAERRLAAAKTVAQQAPYIDAAEARIAEYARDGAAAAEALIALLAGLDGEIEALRRRKDQETAAAVDRLAQAHARIEVQLTSLRRARNEAADQLAGARATAGATAASRETLERIDRTLVGARDRLRSTDNDLARLTAELAALRYQVAEVDRRLAAIAEIETRHRTVEDEGLAWAFLARGCGRDGLQRLEIDAAGPVVSDLANQLLRVGYGARFSVEIVTQVATADGKDLKERFTILAIDNAHGGEARDVGDLSGGERVVVEEAIRAALACYVNLRSRQRCETLWRDETTGSLDPENAPRYVAMLRRLRELSGAYQVLFVTHSPDCAALADAQVRVAQGQATVVLPPYQEAT